MFKVLDEACEPKMATKYSACVDLFAREDVIIDAGGTKIVPLGVKIDLSTFQMDMAYDSVELKEFMSSHYLALFIRSSLALKGLIIPNGHGVIDLDYPDEIGFIVHNPIISSNTSTFSVIAETVRVTPNLNGVGNGVEGRFIIKKGDKIAQCTLMEHKGYLLGIESDVERSGGFGSTGGIR